MQRISHGVMLHRSDNSSSFDFDNPSVLIEIVFNVLAFGPEKDLFYSLCICWLFVVTEILVCTFSASFRFSACTVIDL